MAIIYSLTAPSGSKYIGQTYRKLEARLKEHSEGINNPKLLKRKLYKAIKKYGFSNFNVEILADNINDFEALDALEMEWIDFYKALGIPLYNLTDGGKYFRGLIFTDEMRQQRSEHSKRIWSNPEHAENITRIQKDLWSDESYKTKTLAKMFAARTEQTKIKIANANRGENSNSGKLKEHQVLDILQELENGVKCKELAQKYNVKYDSIWKIKKNKTWTHLSRN